MEGKRAIIVPKIHSLTKILKNSEVMPTFLITIAIAIKKFIPIDIRDPKATALYLLFNFILLPPSSFLKQSSILFRVQKKEIKSKSPLKDPSLRGFFLFYFLSSLLISSTSFLIFNRILICRRLLQEKILGECFQVLPSIL